MSGIMHKIGETLHMGGDHTKEEEAHHDSAGQSQAYGYGRAEHKGEGRRDAGHGYSMTMTGTEYKGEVGHGHVQGEQHKEGLMDKIKDTVHGGETKEHGLKGEKKKEKKHEDGHESSSSSDSD